MGSCVGSSFSHGGGAQNIFITLGEQCALHTVHEDGMGVVFSHCTRMCHFVQHECVRHAPGVRCWVVYQFRA